MEATYWDTLQQTLRDLVETQGLEKQALTVSCRALTAEEAIGKPGREDFPIQKGREVLLEADCCGAAGQAFTDTPGTVQTTAGELARMSLETGADRARFVAGLNAILRHLGQIEGTVHCRDEEPGECSRQLAEEIARTWGRPNVALFGLQPAMAEALSARFPLRIFDLDPEHIGRERAGVVVESGECDLAEVERWAGLFLVTGSSAANGTLGRFLGRDLPVLFYGTTVAGPAQILGVPRYCPCSR